MDYIKILYNAIKTPDGTILESKNRYDFIGHKDKNGKEYSIDGGLDYLKRCFDDIDYEELSQFDNGGHEKRRKYLQWGSNYDKDMNRLPKTIYKFIYELDTNHIKAILQGNHTSNQLYLETFKDELKYRGDNSQLELNL